MTIETTNRTPGAKSSSADSAEPPQSLNTPGEHAIDIVQSPMVRRGIDLSWIRQRLSQAAQIVSRTTGRPLESIDLRIVSDAEMIDLHRMHQGEVRTTDVLSFDLSDADAADTQSPIQADIVICADEAVRQAEWRGHGVERELLLYALHGVLHCAGFDDRSQEEYRRMHAEEDRILKEIGVGATFANDPPTDLSSGGDQA